MKVAVLTTSYPRGPDEVAGAFVRDAVLALRSAGVDLEVVSPASFRHFGLAYGEYAWQGIDAASTALFGGGVRQTLGTVVNCAGLARTVADRCVLGVCVGHETELREICDGGLDAVVGFAHDKLAAMRLDVLHFAKGTAKLVDDDGDGVGDRIADGVWQAELNLGLGLRHAPATFSGTR